MALGNISFLSKTMTGKMSGIGNASNPIGNKSTGVAVQQNNNQSNKTQEPNMAEMSASDLIKHIYTNNQTPEIQDKTGGKQKAMVLPATVEYGNQKFSAYGKDDNAVINDICKKTGDSKSKVEGELKKKYANPSGTSLNMSA